MRLVLLVFALFIFVYLVAQKQGNIWCFGDSAGIDFNNIGNPQPYFSVIRSRGSCVSICDTSGNLICYAAPSVPHITIADSFNVKAFNKNNQLLLNGDSIVGEGWYYELVLVPYPAQNNVSFHREFFLSHTSYKNSTCKQENHENKNLLKPLRYIDL